MNYETLILDNNETKTVTVTLNRPDVHNAMNEQLMKELTDCFQQLSKNKTIHTIILTGSGKSFCAGADLNWMKSMVQYSKEENIKDSALLLDLYETIYSCPKPVIGRINGHAFGGGLGLIAVCDLTIGIQNCKFAFSEVNLGIIPSVISTYVAPRLSPSNMRRLFITGERFTSYYAHHIGLIDIIVPLEELDKNIAEYVKQLESSGPQAIKEVKQLLHTMRTLPREKFKTYTVEKISELRSSKEGQEGINAFLEKRQPKWRN